MLCFVFDNFYFLFAPFIYCLLAIRYARHDVHCQLNKYDLMRQRLQRESSFENDLIEERPGASSEGTKRSWNW